MNNRLNKYKYPGAKRLMLEAQELKDNTEDYCAQPIDDNLFEWHFTVRGPPDTAFDGGYYHGRLSFPTEYPMKPPSIILLTPNGRFETNKKICLSISGYHPETWQPSWSVRTALLALIAFMPTKANRAIGSLDFTDVERRRLAIKSRSWRCETCGLIKDLLVHPESLIEHNSKAADQDQSSGSSTSRVGEDSLSADIDSDGQSQSSSSSEYRDSLTSNSKEVRGSSQSDSDSSVDVQQQSGSKISDNIIQLCSKQVKQHQQKHRPKPFNQQLNTVQYHPDLTNAPSPQHNQLAERPRASYPPLVLKSIFILLSLLILRRVVMVIQS